MADRKTPRLVIFDMDGVLVNSESAFRRACSEALEHWNVKAEYHEFQPFTGMGDVKYIGGVSEKHGVPYVTEMTDISYKLYADYAPTLLKVFPWSKNILLKLHSEGVKIAVASSAGAYKVSVNLNCIGVDTSIFSAIVTGSDVSELKPAPDVFLAAARMAGEPPENCLVLEDALSGIQAAKAAGMQVATVSTSFTADELRDGGSDYVTDDLMTICDEFFDF